MFDIHVDLSKKREPELTALFTEIGAQNVRGLSHPAIDDMTINATVPDEAAIGTLVVKGFSPKMGRASVDFGI